MTSWNTCWKVSLLKTFLANQKNVEIWIQVISQYSRGKKNFQLTSKLALETKTLSKSAIRHLKNETKTVGRISVIYWDLLWQNLKSCAWVYTMCEYYSRLTIKTTEQRHWRCSGTFIVTLNMSDTYFWCLLMLTLNKYIPIGSDILNLISFQDFHHESIASHHEY